MINRIPDLSYEMMKNDRFIALYPNTDAGENALKSIAHLMDEPGKLPANEFPELVRLLAMSGYTIEREFVAY